MIIEFDGQYDFLSNFYPSSILYEGIVYPTNEHFFQAMKTLDHAERQKIAKADTPGKAKRLGRAVTLRPDWELIKIDIMQLGLEEKFKDPILRAKLLATGNTPLVEGNWWHDNFYGDCQCPKCQTILGHNVLGKMLMDLREKIRFQSNS